MKTARLEAFTDGVVAIIITIMVLDLKVPHEASLQALARGAPLLAAYALAYVNVGLYWANHHHLFQASEHVDGRVLWANLFLLFWLSLVPFVVRWLGEAGFGTWPVAAYGIVLGMAAIGYMLTVRMIIAVNGGEQSPVAQAIGSDRKGKLSLAGYVGAVPLAFVDRWIALAIYVAVSAAWLVPDRRIERQLHEDLDSDQSSSSS